MKKGNEMNKAVELTQETAQATLDATVGTVRLAEDSLQGLYKVGYDMNAAGLKVAKGYWDALSSIRNEWINLFAQTGEKAVDSIGMMSNMEIPFQKEVTDLGNNLFTQGEKVFNMAAKQVKDVAGNVSAQVEKATTKVNREAKAAAATPAAVKVEKAAAKAADNVVKAAEKAAVKAAEKTEDAAAKAKNAAAK